MRDGLPGLGGSGSGGRGVMANPIDLKHLAEMRRLGVVWRVGYLPRYPHFMTDEQRREADMHYDAMSLDFVERQIEGNGALVEGGA
jgi:hypothetical protein